jgi:hypothetical protein
LWQRGLPSLPLAQADGIKVAYCLPVRDAEVVAKSD